MELCTGLDGASSWDGLCSPVLVVMAVRDTPLNHNNNISILLSFPGFVHGFLSWRFFLPFSRLAYGIYLIHYSYIRAFTSQNRTPVYFSEMYFFTIYLGCLLAITLLAVVAFLFIELPFTNLERLVFTDRSKNQTKKEAVDNEKTRSAIGGIIARMFFDQTEFYNQLIFYYSWKFKQGSTRWDSSIRKQSSNR